MKKDKKGEADRAEIIDNPTGKYQELKIINKEMESILDLQNNLVSKFDNIEKNLINDVLHDRDIQRKDTVKFVTQAFDNILFEYNCLHEMNPNLREKLYFLVNRITISIHDYCHRLRKSNYSVHATKYLAWAIMLVEANSVLSNVRFLKWRVKLYTELAGCYEDYLSYKSAYKVISQALNKIDYLKSIEDQQVPVPSYITAILEENYRVLRILDVKFGFLSGTYQFDSWKKKLEEYYPGDDKSNRNTCMLNSISNLSKNISVVKHEGMRVQGKIQSIQYMFEIVKTDLANIERGIIEMIEKKKRDKEKKQKFQEQNLKNFQTLLDQYNQLDENMLRPSVWKNSVRNLPIELHFELFKACFDCKLYREFSELLKCLLIRIKYRRVEVPYISEIEIKVTPIQYTNISNKFERVQLDLNINHYKEEIKKLREQGKYVGKVKEQKEDPKGAKKPADKDKDKNKKNEASEQIENPYEQIDGLEHQFIYMDIRRSHNPQKAIINFRIVLNNEKHKLALGDTETARAIPISIYDPQSIKDKLTPYLIYEKSKTGLIDQEEKLKAITDILPIVTNLPNFEPQINYKKYDFELSQYKNNSANYNFNHNYVYFTYKNDENFYVVEKETEILKILFELESSYIEITSNEFKNMKKSNQFFKLNYDIDKLEVFSQSLHKSIEGALGLYFLNEKRNLLYECCILIYRKYLKELLNRIDYFYDIDSELEPEDRVKFIDEISYIKKFISSVLFSIHYILSKIENKDIIDFCYITLRLADLCEGMDNIDTGVEVLHQTIEYVYNYKEEQNKFGLDNDQNPHSFNTFTCDNNKIVNLENTINEKLENHVRGLNFKRRQQVSKLSKYI